MTFCDGNGDLQDDPRDLPDVFPTRDLDLNLNPPRVALRPREQVRQRSPPTLSSSFDGGDVSTMPGAKKGGGGGAGGNKPGVGSPRRPPPPQGPPGSSHPAGGSPSNTRVSHNTEAVLRDADLGTVGKHGLRRTTSNTNCEAAGNGAGLGTVEKHGLRSSTSNPSTPPRSGEAGANKFTVSGSPRSQRAERKARADKLQGLLYPHPDLLADFKSSVGGDFQPHRLLTDVKFRDLLKTFEGKPSGQLRDKLRKMAVSLHKRWYSKASGTTNSKLNTVF